MKDRDQIGYGHDQMLETIGLSWEEVSGCAAHQLDDAVKNFSEQLLERFSALAFVHLGKE